MINNKTLRRTVGIAFVLSMFLFSSSTWGLFLSVFFRPLPFFRGWEYWLFAGAGIALMVTCERLLFSDKIHIG